MKAIYNDMLDNIKNINKTQDENLVDLELLVSSIKAEDAKNLRNTKSFYWIYIVLTLLYTGLLIVNPDPQIGLYTRIGGIFYVSAMISFAILMKKGFKEFKNIDYSVPLYEMLSKVTSRYKLGAKNFLLVSIPVILLDIGLTISFYNDLLPMKPINRILVVQVFYIPIMIISALIGTWIWYKNQKPLRDKALELIKELEN